MDVDSDSEQDVNNNSQRSTRCQSIIDGYCLYLQSIQRFDATEMQERLARRPAAPETEPVSWLVRIALKDRISVKAKRQTAASIRSKDLPCLAEGKDGNWFLVFQKTGSHFLLKRFDHNLPEQYTETELADIFGGRVILFSGRGAQPPGLKYFDIRWFLPEILRYRGFIAELAISAICLQLLALAMPLFFQVVMDKVIVNQARDTLQVLAICLICLAIGECLLQIARNYLAIHTATRIDAKLGAKLFGHLFRLPLSYFSSRSVGVTVMRMTQLGQIREFITGAANNLVFDLLFLGIFLAVMWFYSPLLTFIVLGAIPLCFLVALIITPRLQRYLLQLYHDSAINSAFMTESLGGIETVKSMALEPQMSQRFEIQARDMVHANFKVSRLMQYQEMWVQLIQKTALAGVIWLGARQVIALEITVGQLIAFNMMAQHAMQPVSRLTQLWRDFVQARVSLLQIGDILNTKEEKTVARSDEANDLQGDITFREVTFRYGLKEIPVLQGFNLHIPKGQTLAITGRSGSGKSTLVKLLQKLYIAESGEITIGKQSLNHWPVEDLRRQLAVVQQEPHLFNRTVRDNIALSDPSASLERIMTAAKLAGAHSFIATMEEGYDTLIAEGGQSLSGGQKQRLCIARALLTDPDMLIFDEATSALDEESQQAIAENMAEIARDRTVIIIAHRLSVIRSCDRIVFLDAGHVAEEGTHDSLLADPDSAYSRLWQQQTGGVS